MNKRFYATVFCSLYRREQKYIRVIYIFFLFLQIRGETRRCMLTVQVLASANPDFYPMRFSLCGTSVRSGPFTWCTYTHTHTRAEVCSCVHILNHTTHTHTKVLRISRSRVFLRLGSRGAVDGRGELAGDWLWPLRSISFCFSSGNLTRVSTPS